MSEALRFVPPRVQLVDPRTGMISREWYLFFQGMFNRVGGANGDSIPDIVVNLFEDAGSSETNAARFELEQALSQTPPSTPISTIGTLSAELSALQDRVAELVKELDSIKQGVFT